MRDVSSWSFLGYGEKSTLEKEELLSPDNIEYIMKFSREAHEGRVNWEDINEVIAAEIAKLLNLKTIDAEIALRHGKRGCLMKHFLRQYDADQGEAGGPLLDEYFGNDYKVIQERKWSSDELVNISFSLIQRYGTFDIISDNFIYMNLFDILIGNQDRHSYNWQILYKNNTPFFGPLYDNGASLGWQLPESTLEEMLENKSKLNKFYKKMKVKCGIDENTQPRMKVIHVLPYIINHFPNETNKFKNKLELFSLNDFHDFIDQVPLITNIRKKFLVYFIEDRINKILTAIEKGGIEI